MALWQTQFPALLLLSPFSFFHSPSHSLLKRLSYWFAFCCGESREVAQCVLVKAVPHLPGIIRQLCWKDLSLIPLRWPISHHKEVPGLAFLCVCGYLCIYIGPCYHTLVLILWPTRGRKIFSCQNWQFCTHWWWKDQRGILAAESKQAAWIRRAHNKHPQLSTWGWWNINFVLYSRTMADARRRKPS